MIKYPVMTDKSSRVLRAIREVLGAMRAHKPVQQVMELILEKACGIAGAEQGSFVAVDQESEELSVVCTSGDGWTQQRRECRIPVGKGITGTVARTGEKYLCADVEKDPLYFALFEGVRSELAVPIRLESGIWGIINLDGYEQDAFSPEVVESIEIFADLAAEALEFQNELEQHNRLEQHLLRTEKLAALGNILAGVAHEINNPLTAILGHASLLDLKAASPSEEKSIKAIVSESKRVSALVKDLLTFSRKTPAKVKLCSVNEIVEQTCSLVRYEFKVKGQRLNTELPEVTYPVLIDAHHLQQVLLNLIGNAQHALPEGYNEGFVRVRVHRMGEKLMIEVSDNGEGIPADVGEKIFDPFFTTKPVGHGTGLGLSIANSIIEAHGGNLSFQSDVGKGTTFLIELPLAHKKALEDNPELIIREAEAAVANVVAAPPPRPVKGRVLVIDDENLLLNAVVQFLQRQELSIEAAMESERAIALMKAELFDAVVSDIRLPGRDGIELYHEICKQRPEYSRRFIFMSGDLVRDMTRHRVDETGCPCLEKPFSFQQMLETVIRRIQAGKG